MLNLLKNFVSRSAAALRVSASAGHGLHPPFSKPLGTVTLPPERRGRLKNGNRPGDFLAAPRCGARTRCGGECRQPAMPSPRGGGGRCRLHGGLSTGPRTPEGLARSRRARLTHGARSAQMRALLREARHHARRSRALRARLTDSTAGHGVHRSDSAAASGLPVKQVHHREHSGHREAVLPAARAARIPPSSVSSVANPSSAGHGVHRSISNSTPASGRPVPPRAPAASVFIRAHLCSSVSPLPFLSAGHGVHPPSRSPLRRAKEGRSIFDSRPALR
jgi:hypothetical protein